MKRLIIFILTVFLSGSFYIPSLCLAENTEGKIPEFNPIATRDPFMSQFPKKETEKKKSGVLVPIKKEEIRPPEFTIQGLVWGKISPQAIVNNTVVGLGDSINEAKIIDINKEGIKILFKEEVFFIKPQTEEKK